MKKTDLKWTKEKPAQDGWYFWRAQKNFTDPWKWTAFFVAEMNEGKIYSECGITFWQYGAEVEPPRGGWWARII